MLFHSDLPPYVTSRLDLRHERASCVGQAQASSARPPATPARPRRASRKRRARGAHPRGATATAPSRSCRSTPGNRPEGNISSTSTAFEARRRNAISVGMTSAERCATRICGAGVQQRVATSGRSVVGGSPARDSVRRSRAARARREQFADRRDLRGRLRQCLRTEGRDDIRTVLHDQRRGCRNLLP